MRTPIWYLAFAAATLGLVLAGCTRDTDSLQPAPPNDDPVVFDDNFGEGVDFQAFLGSKFDALAIDFDEKHSGTASLRVSVPAPGNPDATFAGGAFTTNLARFLTGYNALTFWAKASKNSTLNVAGLGNDNTGNSRYEASWSNINLTTEWAEYTIPIPLPSRLTEEKGLFFFAEGPENDQGHQVWLDEIVFKTVNTISNPRPAIIPQDRGTIVGSVVTVLGSQTTFDVGGNNQNIQHLPGYFTFSSSDESVVSVSGELLQVVGVGTAVVTAQLDSVDAIGSLTLRATAPPLNAPTRPTLPASDVISLFSGSYTNVPVDRWSTDWDNTDVDDYVVSGEVVKAYTNLVFAGIEFVTQTVDASSMTHFHMDLWIPQGDVFRIKLVDFGPDNEFGGGDDSEHEIVMWSGFDPPLIPGQWIDVDLPLTDFSSLTGTANLAQLIISGDPGTAYLGNIYFHK